MYIYIKKYIGQENYTCILMHIRLIYVIIKHVLIKKCKVRQQTNPGVVRFVQIQIPKLSGLAKIICKKFTLTRLGLAIREVQTPSRSSTCQAQQFSLTHYQANGVGLSCVIQRCRAHGFSEDFYHCTPGMAGFATRMDSNIILKSNAFNSIVFLI